MFCFVKAFFKITANDVVTLTLAPGRCDAFSSDGQLDFAGWLLTNRLHDCVACWGISYGFVYISACLSWLVDSKLSAAGEVIIGANQ